MDERSNQERIEALERDVRFLFRIVGLAAFLAAILLNVQYRHVGAPASVSVAAESIDPPRNTH